MTTASRSAVAHTLYRATFTAVDVSVPLVCPSCGADLRALGSLRELNWSDCVIDSHVAPKVLLGEHKLEADGTRTGHGDTFIPVGLACAACEWTLEPGG